MTTSTIAPVVWLMCLIYGVAWAFYLVLAAQDYYRIARGKVSLREKDMTASDYAEAEARRRRELVAATRHLVVAICMFMFPASFFFRTSLVLVGLGDEAAGQITFYALAGVNALGVIVAISTKLRPGWFL